MALDRKRFGYGKKDVVRDIRPLYVRFGDWLQTPSNALAICLFGAGGFIFVPETILFADLILIVYLLYFWWLSTRSRALPGKLPVGSKYKDPNNMGPGKSGQPEGILYVGMDKLTGQQIWYSNSDARTHILYLGTTGSGKTEGLKSFAANALTWGSGFVYIDGKADTDLWSSLCSLARRFGRDDDLMVLNYMTGNSDERPPSNTMNPFSSGSASYLSNMLVSLMPEAEGDNAMWKERAVSLIQALMPAMTWKRDNQDFPLSVSTIREYLNLNRVIQMARDESIPERLREGITGYLDTLPGYVADAFDETGKEKPMGPDQPMVDTTTVRQQHGYLTMQFTRALQSLGDDYGYIFDAMQADIDMVDIVLNRRMVVALIPALEKSGDETANLGKIIAATLKGMMGSTLGAQLEGESSTVIENKPTHSSTPFMTIFDEVGYYTSQGMAVMAAQARSLGFCLIFAAQDLQAMEKRVKEEARSITANCNIKIFGKLQDPTQTREFFENHIGKDYVFKVSSVQLRGGMSTGSYHDTQQASVDTGTRADYDDLKDMKEGEAIVSFATDVLQANIFYSNPGHARAMRVTRFIALPQTDDHVIKHAADVTALRDLMVHKTWTAMKADVAVETPEIIRELALGIEEGTKLLGPISDSGIYALGQAHAFKYPDEAKEAANTANAPAPSTQPAVESLAQSAQEAAAQTPLPDQTETAATQPVKEPKKWDELVAESAGGTATLEKPAQTPPAFTPPKLGSDIERILKDAGENMRKSVFKDTKD